MEVSEGFEESKCVNGYSSENMCAYWFLVRWITSRSGLHIMVIILLVYILFL